MIRRAIFIALCGLLALGPLGLLKFYVFGFDSPTTSLPSAGALYPWEIDEATRPRDDDPEIEEP